MPSKSNWILPFFGGALLAAAAIYSELLPIPIQWPSQALVANKNKDLKDNHSAILQGAHKGAAKGERKVLYYRNPMGLPDTSPTPKKDWMGMNYIPVYEGEQHDGSFVQISLDRVQRSGVRTEVAQKRRLSRPIRAPAIAGYDERSLRTITLRADGFIEKLYAEEIGAHIKKGQPLFRIYSPMMVSAQVDYRLAFSERGGRNRTSGLRGAKQKLDNYEVPDAVRAKIRKSGDLVMSFDWPAPVGGVVVKKNVVEGQMVRMGEELFMLADLSKIWMIADVPEQDIGLIKVGQPARMRFKAFPGEVFPGKVSFIMHELEMATRTTKVRIEIDNPDYRIKHTMFATAEIDAGSGDKQRVAVPNSAVINSGDRQVVIVARGEGKFEPRSVILGPRGEDYTEIKSGIDAGDTVVVSANFLIDAESNLKAALKNFKTNKSKKNPSKTDTQQKVMDEPMTGAPGHAHHRGSRSLPGSKTGPGKGARP